MVSDTLEIPDPVKSGSVVRFDLSEVHAAEARIREISTVNGPRAQELMGTFSKACFTLGRILPTIHMNHRLAEKRVGDRLAVIVVDLMGEIIRTKDLANNDTTRKAILALDAEHSQAVEDEIKTQAVLIYVERKLRDMEGAFHAVKKIHETTMGVTTRANPNLAHEQVKEDLTEGERLALEEPSPPPPSAPKPATTKVMGNVAFGKPKYY